MSGLLKLDYPLTIMYTALDGKRYSYGNFEAAFRDDQYISEPDPGPVSRLLPNSHEGFHCGRAGQGESHNPPCVCHSGSWYGA